MTEKVSSWASYLVVMKDWQLKEGLLPFRNLPLAVQIPIGTSQLFHQVLPATLEHFIDHLQAARPAAEATLACLFEAQQACSAIECFRYGFRHVVLCCNLS